MVRSEFIIYEPDVKSIMHSVTDIEITTVSTFKKVQQLTNDQECQMKEKRFVFRIRRHK